MTERYVPTGRAPGRPISIDTPEHLARREYMRGWQAANKDRQLQLKRARNAGKRADVLSYLGGQCVRCGFSDPRALQVDHVAGDGRQERAKLGTSGIYREVLSGDFDDKYQLLCANCNWIKRAENGEHS